MKLKKYFYILLSLLYLDLIFNLFVYDTYLRSSLFNIVLFDMVNAAFITILTSLFNDKINKIITYVIYAVLIFWYGLYYVFYRVLLTPFSFVLFRQTDQILKFSKNVIISVLQNLHVILLFAVPIIIFIIFRKKIKYERAKLKTLLIYFLVFIVAIGMYIGNILIQKRGIGSTYNLYYETNNVSLNIERLGVMGATYLDLKRAIFGLDKSKSNSFQIKHKKWFWKQR